MADPDLGVTHVGGNNPALVTAEGGDGDGGDGGGGGYSTT